MTSKQTWLLLFVSHYSVHLKHKYSFAWHRGGQACFCKTGNNTSSYGDPCFKVIWLFFFSKTLWKAGCKAHWACCLFALDAAASPLRVSLFSISVDSIDPSPKVILLCRCAKMEKIPLEIAFFLMSQRTHQSYSGTKILVNEPSKRKN